MTQLYVSMGFFPEEYFTGTVDYIVRTQDADGAIPWFEGGPMDPWDHIESAMGLAIGGRFDEAKAAYRWLKDNQLPNGSWLAAYKDGEVEDGTRAESNFVAYIATGVWQYHLISDDKAFLEEMWDTVSGAIEFVLRLQGPEGQIYWCEDTTLGIREDSLVTGCSSIYKSLECALNIATTLDQEVPHWALARTRLGHAIGNHPEVFDRTWDSKSRFAMDWFYPVLTNVIQGSAAKQHLHSRWHEFVVSDLGCVCVNDEPWVTVAESCELVMSLLAAGQYQQAVNLFSWLHQFRDEDGSYWTGYVHRDDALWPLEKPTWTAGAVLMAADALSNKTGAAHLFRQELIVNTGSSTTSMNTPG
ncbi:MAG: prenyltransferase [Pseudomonadales bacterium]|nr:prenyltransferase [Pseudomonadales bacterium]MBO6565060.1 prenyltransferase [Pseudomonadales bacterium]MBO6594313.1 prenyltransferase [Pseudomonadales bacterium]MBO6657509.1 prenyltransferase [Pseudomonadales bacterium]MBO6822126.1 prenyltransferase [Pseudomonadales bacterium]